MDLSLNDTNTYNQQDIATEKCMQKSRKEKYFLQFDDLESVVRSLSLS